MSELPRRVVETILEDRQGEGHFRDPENLTHYLLGSYAPGSCLFEQSRSVADDVLEMLDDDADAGRLAAHIERAMSAVLDRARHP